MQYIKLKKQAEDVDLFSDDEVEEGIQPISHEAVSYTHLTPK